MHTPVLRDWKVADYPNSLTAADDGNIWFENGILDEIAFITPTGSQKWYRPFGSPSGLMACARTKGAVRTCDGRQRGVWLVNGFPSGNVLEHMNESGRVRISTNHRPPLRTPSFWDLLR